MRPNTTREEVRARIFLKYQYLVKKYASKIYSDYQLGLEREDIEQELSIKLLKTITAYRKSVLKFARKEAPYKPIAAKYYFATALSREVSDIKKSLKLQKERFYKQDIADFDLGNDYSMQLDPEKGRYVIHGVDLCENLKGIQAGIFKLYLNGWKKNKIQKHFRKHKGVKVVNDQIQYLQQYKNVLLEGTVKEFVVQKYED